MRDKLGRFIKGHIVSEATREKMKQAQLGKKHPHIGHKCSEETRRKISEANIGHKHSEETKRKISKTLMGNPSPRKGVKLSEETKEKIGKANYKGDKAGYVAIHIWVKKHRGKAKICEHCGKNGKEWRIEWANIDHEYRRNLDDYISLCVSCHSIYDRKYNWGKKKIWLKKFIK